MKERLEVIISANAAKFQAGMKKAESSVKGFKEQAQKVGNKVKEVMDKMTTQAKAAAANIGKAITGITAGIGLLTASTEEFRQNQAQLNAAFEQASFSAESATGIYRELYKTIGDDDQAVESAANIAMLADSEQEAARWAELASGVLGTFHDTLQPEAFYEAANETMKLGEATGAFTQMLEQTGVMSVDEFNKKLAECTTEAEKQAFMLEVSEKAMGAAGETYDEQTKKLQAQREAQAKLNATLGKLADAVTPLVTAFMTFANNALQPVIDKITPLAEQYAPQLEEAMSKAGDAVGKAFGFFIDNWGILAAISGVIAGIAAAVGIYNAVIAIQTGLETARAVATTITNSALWAQAAALWAAYAPLLPWIIAIAAVIAIVAVMITHWDKVKETVLNVCTRIKEEFQKMGEKVAQLWDFLKQAISEKVEAIKTAVTEKFQAVKDAITQKVQAAKDAALSVFESIRTGISDKVNAAKNTVSNVFESIKSAISTKINAAKSTVLGVFDSIQSGISNKINAAKNAVGNAINTIKGFFNFSWSLPHLKLPHPYISGKFSLNPPQVPSFGIRWYAKGGVFDSKTLFGYGNGQIGGLGEAGSEAIVPLEDSPKWVSAIAKQMASELGGGQPIILMVDGTKLGEAAAKGINQITKQTGNVPLVLA